MTEIIDKQLLDKIMHIFKDHIDEKHIAFNVFDYIEKNPKNERHIVHLVHNGKCTAFLFKDIFGTFRAHPPMALTAEGMDYFSRDGGLTAQRKTITIRFEEETIKKLIEAKIDGINTTKEEKHKLKQYLKSLTGKLLEQKMLDLLTLGINHIPDIYRWLGK